ncbi:MAG: D-aminoacyl-tRNA deacylase [Paludibacteraceae bacterium]|nr:D-aminoacyl-tRNA deacylase [Paludibacteraceae bacterium]
MRLVIQRVRHASVVIDDVEKSHIGQGLMVLVGIEDADSEDDADWLAQKITKLRIFDDADGIMNLSVNDIDGEILVVSQFTLFAMTAKGNRPSYIRASRPEHAIPLYEHFVAAVQRLIPSEVQTGVFGADMKVTLLNDGPVTILMDSKNKE